MWVPGTEILQWGEADLCVREWSDCLCAQPSSHLQLGIRRCREGCLQFMVGFCQLWNHHSGVSGGCPLPGQSWQVCGMWGGGTFRPLHHQMYHLQRWLVARHYHPSVHLCQPTLEAMHIGTAYLERDRVHKMWVARQVNLNQVLMPHRLPLWLVELHLPAEYGEKNKQFY